MRTRWYVAAALFALVGAAWLLGIPPFQGAPSFFRNVVGGERRYVCGEGPRAETLTVRFSGDGRHATAWFRGRPVRLAFSHTTLFEDVYENGPWSLHLDPEANLYGPDGFRTYNCS